MESKEEKQEVEIVEAKNEEKGVGRRVTRFRRIVPRLLNIGATLFLLGSIIPGFIVGLVYVNPVVFRDYPNLQTFNKVFLIYGLMMLLGNWVLIGASRKRRRSGYTPPSADNGHYFCTKCNAHQPPRAHHCDLCQACVLRHDHHCFFAASCIGHHNQRYFVVFTAWLAFGCFSCFLIAIAYIRSDAWREEMTISNFIFPPLAAFRFLMGYNTMFEMYVVFAMQSMSLGVCAGGMLTGIQFALIRKGLTAHENKKGLVSPVLHLTEAERMRLALGKNWFLNFLLPIGPFTPLMSDGTRWNDSGHLSDKEHNK